MLDYYFSARESKAGTLASLHIRILYLLYSNSISPVAEKLRPCRKTPKKRTLYECPFPVRKSDPRRTPFLENGWSVSRFTSFFEPELLLQPKWIQLIRLNSTVFFWTSSRLISACPGKPENIIILLISKRIKYYEFSNKWNIEARHRPYTRFTPATHRPCIGHT